MYNQLTQISSSEHYRRMKELMEKYNMLLVRRDKEEADHALTIQELEKVLWPDLQIIRDLREQLDQRDRKLGLIPTMEKELSLLRGKYESEMRAK